MSPCPDTYLPWFILLELPGLSPRVIKKLIHYFGTPEAILKASRTQLLSLPDPISSGAIKSLLGHKEFKPDAQNRLAQARDCGHRIMVLTDPDYPALLKEIPDPPALLFHDGTFDPNKPCISIVGSRNATRYGMDTASYLARRLTDLGFTIVSGMALGIDTAAHNGALENEIGQTLAVLGSGLDHIYPRHNRPLYNRIIKQGAVISEYFPDTAPLPGNFPQRNRIIAGLSCGTVVVEAAQKSGSLITARLSGEYNREVFAVPGSIKSSQSRGTHHLIKQGAHLIENEMDIIDELSQFVHAAGTSPLQEPAKNKPAMDKIQTIVYKHLDLYPGQIDHITASSGLTSAQVSAALLDLELSGLIVRHPGNKFSILEE
ncbi:DNA-processing protein DprA [uncultured Desulfobacter sp.]|uniref:DNA-processing protein DprA n=1 Tax=uncultured Desulfobacter sp. TaxID=240139 RepID=UPI002AAC2161|nr:DNA-processing protein DprA [uncultured Desulfobacter sp.]